MLKPAKNRLTGILFLAGMLSLASTGFTDKEISVQPSKKDKCPVCGMFVYKYPDWLCQITFKDGTERFFDGPKDLFKYYFNIREHDPRRNRTGIDAVLVREYYDLDFIDARKAYFVAGSDVYGPMGHELIPLASVQDAKAFMKDHKGRRILSFDEITAPMVRSLDLGPDAWSWMGKQR